MYMRLPSRACRERKGGKRHAPKASAAMSDSQVTAIARLNERLQALKERL
jgi:hypothetical protein